MDPTNQYLYTSNFIDRIPTTNLLSILTLCIGLAVFDNRLKRLQSAIERLEQLKVGSAGSVGPNVLISDSSYFATANQALSRKGPLIMQQSRSILNIRVWMSLEGSLRPLKSISLRDF